MMPPLLGLIGREDEKPATACIVGASAMAFQKWITMAVTMDLQVAVDNRTYSGKVTSAMVANIMWQGKGTRPVLLFGTCGPGTPNACVRGRLWWSKWNAEYSTYFEKS
jgi:hypothetical protein